MIALTFFDLPLLARIRAAEAATSGSIAFLSGAYSVPENTPGYVTLYVNRSGARGTAASVYYITSDGTGVTPTDYLASEGTLNWGTGENGLKSFNVPIVNNTQWVAVDKGFTASLISITGDKYGNITKSNITIIDDDVYSPGYFTFDSEDITIAETAGNVTVGIERVYGTDGASSVDYEIRDDQGYTAIEGVHYSYTPGTLNWAHGEGGIKYIDIGINHIAGWNADTYFNVTMANPVNSSTGWAFDFETVYIQNVDPYSPGAIRFQNTTYEILEPDGSPNLTGSLVFTVQRTGGADGASGVQFSQSNGSATFPVDYKPSVSGLAWSAGDSGSKTFAIEVYRNTGKNTDIGFTASLYNFSNSTSGSITKSIGTILNTLNPSVIGFIDASHPAYEPDRGSSLTSSVVFFIGRTGGSGISAVTCSTSDNTATGGVDYKTTSSMISWANGDLTPKSMSVEIYRNTLKNTDIQFTTSLSGFVNASGGAITKSAGIILDISYPGLISFASHSYVAYESASSVTFHLSRSQGSDGQVSVMFTTIDGTALSGSSNPYDYKGQKTPVTWSSGEVGIKTINILLNGEDNIIDGDKIFTGSLFGIQGGAILGLSQSTVTIIDTTTQIGFYDAIFVGEDSAATDTLWFERLGYGGTDVSMSIISLTGINTHTPSGQITRGIEAESENWGETYTISWSSGSNAIANKTISLSRTAQGAGLCTQSINAISPFCTRYGPQYAESVDIEDGGWGNLNVFEFEYPTTRQYNVPVYATPHVIEPSIRNRWGCGTTSSVSYITLDGTAKSGSDYDFTDDFLLFNNPGGSGNGTSAPTPVNVYPSLEGKYFYIQLYDALPWQSSSVAYPTRIKVYGEPYAGSTVTFVSGSYSKDGTGTVDAVPFDVHVSRSGVLTDALTVKVTVGGVSSNVDEASFHYLYDYTVYWDANEGGVKVVKDPFEDNTFIGAVTSSYSYSGYLSMSLSKNNSNDQVVFGPYTSTFFKFSKPTVPNLLYFYPPDYTISNPTTPSVTGVGYEILQGDNCPNLTSLDVSNNRLTTLTITNAPSLTSLNFNNNSMSYFSMANTLTQLFCNNNKFTSLNLSSNTALGWLQCSNNPLTSLTLPTGVGLGSLSCEYTKLTSLNLVGCTGLNDAFLRGNRFTQAAVDNLLSASVVNGVNNGQIWLDGFGNAAPSATGLGYKATLESAGRGFWLVVVNT